MFTIVGNVTQVFRLDTHKANADIIQAVRNVTPVPRNGSDVAYAMQALLEYVFQRRDATRVDAKSVALVIVDDVPGDIDNVQIQQQVFCHLHLHLMLAFFYYNNVTVIAYGII